LLASISLAAADCKLEDQRNGTEQKTQRPLLVDNKTTDLNIFNSPELVANKQIITNTRKKKEKQ